MGIFSLLPKKEKISSDLDTKEGLIQKISHLKLNYCFMMVGELGDKTFLASIGFGIQYPTCKFLLVLGAIFGMIVSDSIAIVFGKLLNKYISEAMMQKISGVLFLIFGFIGFFF